MVDVFNSAERSAIMAKVRSKDTGPERIVRSALHSAGFRFRKHVRTLPGSPDVVLPRYKLAIFIHGCFWHGHDCKRAKLPSTNVEAWETKISKNQNRDHRDQDALTKMGWRVQTIWTCELKDGTQRLIETLQRERSEFDFRH